MHKNSVNQQEALNKRLGSAYPYDIYNWIGAVTPDCGTTSVFTGADKPQEWFSPFFAGGYTLSNEEPINEIFIRHACITSSNILLSGERSLDFSRAEIDSRTNSAETLIVEATRIANIAQIVIERINSENINIGDYGHLQNMNIAAEVTEINNRKLSIDSAINEASDLLQLSYQVESREDKLEMISAARESVKNTYNLLNGISLKTKYLIIWIKQLANIIKTHNAEYYTTIFASNEPLDSEWINMQYDDMVDCITVTIDLTLSVADKLFKKGFTWHHVFMGYEEAKTPIGSLQGRPYADYPEIEEIEVYDATNWKKVWHPTEIVGQQGIYAPSPALLQLVPSLLHESTQMHLGSTAQWNILDLPKYDEKKKIITNSLPKVKISPNLSIALKYSSKEVSTFEKKLDIKLPELAKDLFCRTADIREFKFSCGLKNRTSRSSYEHGDVIIQTLFPLEIDNDRKRELINREYLQKGDFNPSIERSLFMHTNEQSRSYLEPPVPNAIPFAWDEFGELLYVSDDMIFRYEHEFDRFTPFIIEKRGT